MGSPTRKTLGELAKEPNPSVASKAALVLDVLNQQLPDVKEAGLGPDTSLDVCLNILTAYRSNVPDKDPSLSRLDAAIVPLVEIQRQMFSGGPYDIASEPAPPSPSGPSLLLDLTERNLRNEVAAILGVEYLSEANSIERQQRVEGTLWGPAFRPLICLPAQRRDSKPINVFLLVDTGAPVTELSPKVFEAMGFPYTPAAAIINLGGSSRTQVRLSNQGEHSNHKDISILGADFLAANKCTLAVDYAEGTVAVCFP